MELLVFLVLLGAFIVVGSAVELLIRWTHRRALASAHAKWRARVKANAPHYPTAVSVRGGWTAGCGHDNCLDGYAYLVHRDMWDAIDEALDLLDEREHGPNQ